MKWVRDIDIRNALKNDLVRILEGMNINGDGYAEQIIYRLECLGWHGVRDDSYDPELDMDV